MLAITHVSTDKARVTTRLAELGLLQEDLRDAVAFGIAEAGRWTPNDPPTARGIYRWAREVGSLRETLTARDWQCVNDDNYPTVMNAARTIALAVSSGDAKTGTDGTPRTPPRGPATRRIIDRNQGLLADFAGLGSSDPSYPRDIRSEAETWLLLSYEDELTETVRLELSLPVAVNDDGSVALWRERIILEPIGQPGTTSTASDDQVDESIDVPVSRRAG